MLTGESAVESGVITMRGRRRTLLAALLAGLLLVSSCSLIPYSTKASLGLVNEHIAYFDNVAGLYDGNDVAVLGMPIGRVLSVEPQGTRVKVVLAVDKNIDLPKDVRAAIVNTSIVTTRHIELTPAYTGGDKLGSSDQIGSQELNLAPVEIGTLFDSIDSMIDELSAGDGQEQGALANLIDLSAEIADGNGQALNEALTALAQAGRVGADNADAIGQILNSFATITTALTDNYPKMLTFSNTVTQVSEMLGDQSTGLVATLGNLNQTLENTSQFLAANSGTLGVSLNRLTSLAVNLSDYSRQVVEAVDLGPLLFQNLANSVSAEQGAWRASVLTDKSLLDNELLLTLCRNLNIQEDGCRTGQLLDFGPDLGVFSALMELSKE